MHMPRLVIAGTESGVGKTSVAIGLVRALHRRGLAVQPFKVGPDFLDPTYLRLAAGRECYNLDPWMCGEDYVRRLFARASADADVAIVEGVMGMYDGASPDSSAGSTAALAALLEAPVVLLANAGGLARSFAALVKGYAEFENRPRVAGVLANRVGSNRHAEMLRTALQSTDAPPLLGAFPKEAFPELADRHLGLVTADEDILPDRIIEHFALACEQHIELDRLLSVSENAAELDAPADELPSRDPDVRLAVARDRAFHFYYPDNLEMLEALGAELVPFSPVTDADLPEADALYLGGGYPEEFAAKLSANESMRNSIHAFCEGGHPVYAECGGLMYLSRSLRTTGGEEFPLCGVLPARVEMLSRRRALGYAEVELTDDCLLGPQGRTLRGHEFHYSELLEDPADHPQWNTAYSVRKRSGASTAEGYRRGNVLASYVHLHLASRPQCLENLLERCRKP
jgi:cobyrinic acid a,c-diamide synthase